MKILLTATALCLINIICISSMPDTSNANYNSITTDTIPPAFSKVPENYSQGAPPSNMQPAPQSTVSGNNMNTPILPTDTIGKTNRVLDTSRILH